MPTLRPITPADVEAVLALNQRDVVLLSPLDAARLERLRGWADRADVVDVDGEVAGFFLTFGPGTPYDGGNYRWYAERYGEQFYYLDRIVLDPRFRRRGLGGLVYDAVERDAAAYSRLALEVNTDPPNEPSLAFHARRGFVQVGERDYGDGTLVAMLVKELVVPDAGPTPR
ncbi:GNAT family N-acetyltransferase [Nocardioides pantholopis]|uniref:GNAT family N-acetyltransferase n=1 Tax=Nocardioides pantholopis TaxID=2483798 RepID=UPI001F498AC7|nr:GNAT family N-acetyltransferase [Nocardioides pantholopis]